MTATGPAIMNPAHAVAAASIEGDLSSHIAQFQKTVRSQQATFDEQEARVHNTEILVARMMQRLGIPVSAGAMILPSRCKLSDRASGCTRIYIREHGRG